MILGKYRFLTLLAALVFILGIASFAPSLQSEAQAATVAEQRLQSYIKAHPAGGSSTNCMAFAKGVSRYIFGVEPSGLNTHGNPETGNLQVVNRYGSSTCGSTSGSTSGAVTAANVQKLLAAAEPGDIIQGVTSGNRPHTMVFVKHTSNGVVVYHGSWNGKIAYSTFTYSWMASKWGHMLSLYHSTNYDAVNANSKAYPTSVSAMVNDSNVNISVFSIDGEKYYYLRDIAYLVTGTDFEFDVSYDDGIAITTGTSYLANGTEMEHKGSTYKKAEKVSGTIKVNGTKTATTYYAIDGSAYFSIRDLAEILGFTVGWNSGTVIISVK